MRLTSLQDKVILITGASSGIGKLAVEEFLKQGARVVMAARSEEPMREHLLSLNVGSDRALVVRTDISDVEQVKELARQAQNHFGRIDVWINNAAVNLYGTVDEISFEDIRRVIDVDLLGQIYGMKVALDLFKQQGFGNIINVGSVDAIGSLPLQAPYSAAKHGLLGFSCSLREELMSEKYRDLEIDVIDVLPASMDTPLFKHAKSVTGKQPKPIPPVYDPILTVDALIRHAKHPKPMVIVGNAGKMMAMEARMMPEWFERMMSGFGMKSQMSEEPKRLDGGDNLYSPAEGNGHDIRSGFCTTTGRMMTAVEQHPIRTLLMAAGAVFLLSSLFMPKRAVPG